MADTQNTLQDLINASTLTDADKKMFITFLETASEEDVTGMTEVFNNDPEELITFWTMLKAKLTLIQVIESDDNFSDSDKARITNQIIAMDDEEFSAFITGIEQVSNSDNPKDTLEKLIKEQKETHIEFMNQSKDFLKKLQESHKNLQKDKDEDDYEDTLAKINSLKS